MRRFTHIIYLTVTLVALLLYSCEKEATLPQEEQAGSAVSDSTALKRDVHDMVNAAQDLIEHGYINNGFEKLSEAEKIVNAVADGENIADSHDMYCLTAYKAKIFLAYRDYRNAAKYYERSITFAPTRRDSLQMTLDYSVISCHSGDSVAAVKSAAKIAGFNIPDTLYKHYAETVAQAYIEKFFGDRHRSRNLFARSLEISRTDGFNPHSQLTPLSELYDYYSSTEDLDSMLFFLRDYKKLAEAFKTPEMMADVNKGFLKSYIMMGNKEKALEAFDGYFSIMDSLYNPAGFSAMNSRYNDEIIINTNDKMMRLELKVSRLKMIIILITSGVVLAIAIWFVCRKLIQSRKRIFFLNREIARNENPDSGLMAENDTSDNSRQAELMRKINDALADPAVYCDPDFCISTLAGLVESNSKYVSQAINDCTGMNFRTFINSLRIKIARIRLTESEQYSNRTIQAVSESVGFKSTSNFVIAFKKVMGITPSAYQKLALQKNPFD